jgi:hypothetical protein
MLKLVKEHEAASFGLIASVGWNAALIRPMPEWPLVAEGVEKLCRLLTWRNDRIKISNFSNFTTPQCT